MSQATQGTVLGAGRSGVVYKRRDAHGRLLADKVFNSTGLTKLVQYVFLGAPNPYAWSEDAVRAAVVRRKILARLVELWFGDDVVVANAYGHSWDEENRTFCLHTAFADGVAPTLHHPMNRRGSSEVRDLWARVMKPLQRHLDEAGCDGLAWQAGLGNPVALANFLRLRGDGPLRWAWIDLESGVPALFPADVRTLFSFYLPRSLKFGRPLFDDIDVERLDRYVTGRREALVRVHGEQAYVDLLRDVAALGEHQEAWRAIPRHARSVAARHAKGDLTDEQAAWYSARPLRWYARELSRVPGKAIGLAGRLAAAIWGRIREIPWSSLPRRVPMFLVSQSYRYQVAHKLVGSRIDSWEKRGQLVPEEARHLRGNLESEESSAYLTDFGVHVAIKPFVKFVEYAVFPALFAAGIIGPGVLALVLLGAGCFARTAYTLGRLVQSTLIGHEKPWVALGVGLLPVFGNFAYPLQIIYSSTVVDDIVAQFLLYDGCSILGRKLPIWGGRDTLTEHAFNHLPDRLVRSRA
jgi:hypothetical protein